MRFRSFLVAADYPLPSPEHEILTWECRQWLINFRTKGKIGSGAGGWKENGGLNSEVNSFIKKQSEPLEKNL